MQYSKASPSDWLFCFARLQGPGDMATYRLSCFPDSRSWQQSAVLNRAFFSPTNYPQKPPHAVSVKLSSTPKTYKTAHLLKFFGKMLCQLRF